jgi:hypothetical protein
VIRTVFRHVTACEPTEMERLPDVLFTAVVICHTVHVNDYEACVTIVRRRWREAVIIRIARSLLDFVDGPEAAISSQPAALLQALASLH